MDIRIISVLISASVALFIAILNHFIITPIKEKRKRKREQLNNLYAPLYSLISTRLNIVKPQIVIKGEYLLGSNQQSVYLNKEYMETFFLERSGYASDKMIDAWIGYTGVIIPDRKATKNFITQMVFEYNQLKKELGLNYNSRELETGIPEVLKDVKFND